ncbi:MAG: hypothetical protein P8184_18605 [Calditrichia bacterium]
MHRSRRMLFINSTLAFVTAFFLTTFIHEGGHFIAYLLSGAHPVMYHNYVQTPAQLSTGVEVIGSLAGPLISLLQGIVFGLIVYRKPGNSAGDLLMLWLSLLGFINFFGYLLLTPLSTVGDTGKAAELLQIGYPWRILTAAVGISVLIILVIRTGKYFTNFIPPERDLAAKKGYINSVLFFPILAGSVVNVAFAFPVPAALSVIYPATSSFAIMMAFGTVLRTAPMVNSGSKTGKRVSGMLLVMLPACIIINRLLTLGLR